MTVPTTALESQILGALVNSPDKIPVVLHLLNTDDFADADNREYFKTIQQRSGDGLLIDEAEMVIALDNKGLHQLPSKCFDEFYKLPVFNLDQKISNLKAESLKRYAKSELAQAIQDIDKGLLDAPEAVSSRMADIVKSIMARTPETNERTVSRLVRDAINNANRQRTDLVMFGIPCIDALLKGLEPGEMVTIAARTGIGKSALALDPLLSTGLDGKWAVMISTEMTIEQISLRAVSKLSGVSQSVIKGVDGRRPTSEQTQMITKAIDRIDHCKIKLFDNIRTVGQIEAEIQKMKSAGNIVRLVVVDYIQQLKADRSRSSRQEEVSEISNRLMTLAIHEGLTVIVCAQLNRQSDPYGTPDLSHIKDCGSIEQDSSRVIALTRSRTDPTLTHFHLMKNRPGELGQCELTFFGSVMRFFPAH